MKWKLEKFVKRAVDIIRKEVPSKFYHNYPSYKIKKYSSFIFLDRIMIEMGLQRLRDSSSYGNLVCIANISVVTGRRSEHASNLVFRNGENPFIQSFYRCFYTTIEMESNYGKWIIKYDYEVET